MQPTCQAAFEGAHRFHRGFPGGDFAVVVGAAFGRVAELDHGAIMGNCPSIRKLRD